ncbi:MAG: molybdopterin-dependent oxidoreductase [Jatrophihabitans sp.]
MIPEKPPPFWPKISERVRHEAVTARVGRILGIAFTLCFFTGLYSHYQYHPTTVVPIPSLPSWGYRLTQGIHVITGMVCIPLILIKLWSVYPKLFSWPPFKTMLQGLERLSILVLISASLVELTTGFLNILGWYPWPWAFIKVHYWLAFVIIGSIMLHVAVKLPIIKRGLATPLSDVPEQDPEVGGITRRGVLVAGGVGAGIVTLGTVGQVVTPLQPVSVLSVRQPKNGPLGVAINITAKQAGVVKLAQAADYRFEVMGPKPFMLTLTELEALETEEKALPIACVEGWSAMGHWTGPRLLDLVKRAGGNGDSHVHVLSVQKAGPDHDSKIFGPQMRAALLATHLNGVRLPLDHGYPLRLIAPNRSGALQTKWVSRLEVT